MTAEVEGDHPCNTVTHDDVIVRCVFEIKLNYNTQVMLKIFSIKQFCATIILKFAF